MHVLDMPRQFFMVRFEIEKEYLEALIGGPWRAFGSYMMVRAWSLDFDPLWHEIMTTPAWIRVSNILVIFYQKTILMGMARGLGRPLKLYLNTMNIERARFARICVEVDLRKPLKGKIMINGDRYFVSYEGLNLICSGYGVYGHLVHSCPRRAPEKEVVATARMEVELNKSTVQVAYGFTEVRQKRQGPGSSSKSQMPAGADRECGRNLREIQPSNF
ncbi:uncharacterized protein LOC17880066 [Capsella rubella]|nr:uncharacterized protein LOC17880066 [Capsella rubella]